MSTNHQPNSKNEEEVDLGSLFQIIGKGFANFFNFIGDIFKGIFHAIIVVLLFLKTNAIAIVIAGLIGVLFGFFVELKSPDLYRSELLVKPNFKSSKLLYNNINFYNDLIKQKDTASLQSTFGISKEDAGSLKKITIEPIVSEYDIVDSYNKFVTEADTTTIKSYEYLEFKTSFTDLDYKIHKIEAISEKNDVFFKLENTITMSLEKNKYFERLKEYTYRNLSITDTLIKRSIAQIDSLQKSIVISTVATAENPVGGTNIDLGSQNFRPKEVELIESNRRLIEDLNEIVEDKSEKNVVINIVSGFKPVGSKISGIAESFIFKLGLFGVIGMIFILLLIKLNAYLNNFKK